MEDKFPAILQESINSAMNDASKNRLPDLYQATKYFVINFYKINITKNRLWRFCEVFLRLFSPSPYVYLLLFIKEFFKNILILLKRPFIIPGNTWNDVLST